jgi:hypothetical protein
MNRMELILKSLNDLEQCLSGMIDQDGGQVCPKSTRNMGTIQPALMMYGL